MTDNELLLAISDIVQSQTDPIKQSVQENRSLIETLMKEHREEVQKNRDTRSLLENLTEEHHREVQKNRDTRSLLENLTEEHRDTRSLLENLTEEHRDTRSLLENLIMEHRDEAQKNHETRLLIENEILPRLQNIEACYTTTYHRYADGIQQIEALQNDVDVLKIVVTEHSEILERIS